MSNRNWLIIVVVLTLIVAVLAWILFTTPRSATQPIVLTPATTSPTTVPTDTSALSAHVKVSSPKSGGSVGKDFDVSGEAPGPWFFEATFPIQVRDKDDNVLGRSHASAQGEWMTEGQVKFTATVHIDGSYSGPATLILLKDNPSGLPENDDSIEIPIVIQ